MFGRGGTVTGVVEMVAGVEGLVAELEEAVSLLRGQAAKRTAVGKDDDALVVALVDGKGFALVEVLILRIGEGGWKTDVKVIERLGVDVEAVVEACDGLEDIRCRSGNVATSQQGSEERCCAEGPSLGLLIDGLFSRTSWRFGLGFRGCFRLVFLVAPNRGRWYRFLYLLDILFTKLGRSRTSDSWSGVGCPSASCFLLFLLASDDCSLNGFLYYGLDRCLLHLCGLLCLLGFCLSFFLLLILSEMSNGRSADLAWWRRVSARHGGRCHRYIIRYSFASRSTGHMDG